MKIFKKFVAKLFKRSEKKSMEQKKQQPVEKTRTPKSSNQKKKQSPKKSTNQKNKPNSQKNKPKHHVEKTHSPKPQVKKRAPKVIPLMPELVESPEAEGKTRFTEFDIRREILAALQDLKFQYCTPIQAMSLSDALSGKDIAGKAQTGTGKTASFLIAAINTLLNNPIKEHRRPGSARVIILAPTRELAIQIHKDAEQLTKYTDLNNVVIYGGMGHAKQKEQLSDPVDILVATPGRCIDFMQQRAVDLSRADILIIDEADRMLDMGFIPDVRKIVNRTPHPGKRHTMMYSATLAESVMRLVRTWSKDPVQIEIEDEEMVTDLIEQKFWSVMSSEKMNMLQWILKNEDVKRMIIFINRKDQASKVCRKLKAQGIEAVEMTGDVPQKKRMSLLADLKAGRIKILIATDVAARGIHVDDMSHVVNYDLPVKAEDYVHRIGRTGRAGNKGTAHSFVCESGAYVFSDIEALLDEEISCVLPEPEMVQ